METIHQEYGEDVAMVNFLMNLCGKGSGATLHKFLFKANPLTELRGSQLAGESTETLHSQGLILIYKSRRQQASYAIQIEKHQIYMDMDFIDIFITCLKCFYLFSMEYPHDLKHYYSFWEQQLKYGIIKPTYTVQRISRAIEKCLDQDEVDDDEDVTVAPTATIRDD